MVDRTQLRNELASFLEFRRASEININHLEQFEVEFKRIAIRLLNGCTLFIAQQPHAMCEIEFYYKGYSHQDPFTHCSDLQKYACWYFHRVGKGYRGGNYKGLDISFGDVNSYGGILIRSLRSLRDPAIVIDGPCLCVDYILRLNSCSCIAEFVERQSSLSVLSQEHGAFCSGLYIDVLSADSGTVMASPRVGLRFPRDSEDKLGPLFIMRPYRFVDSPCRSRKGLIHSILGLIQQGTPVADIAQLTRAKLPTVKRYLTAFEAGKEKNSIGPAVLSRRTKRKRSQFEPSQTSNEMGTTRRPKLN